MFGVAAVFLIGVLALTAGRDRSAAPPSAPPSARAPSPAPTPVAVPAATSFTRTCADSVSQSVGAGSWRQSVFAGPLAIVRFRQAAGFLPFALGRQPHGYQPGRYLVAVKQGHKATLSIPASEQAHVALLYNLSTGRYFQLSAGNVAVNFQACSGSSTSWRRATQFNGGILVDGARCVTLDVRDEATNRRWRITAPFGRGTCAGVGTRATRGTETAVPF